LCVKAVRPLVRRHADVHQVLAREDAVMLLCDLTDENVDAAVHRAGDDTEPRTSRPSFLRQQRRMIAVC
jgi:hypothetical protein